MKNKQGITIAALIIAIIGLSVGFAAFSNTLTISQGASINPDPSSLKVVFAKDYFTEQKTTLNQLDTTAVVPTTVGTGITATNGVINNDGQNGPTLTGLSAAFTEPGQSATYNLYVVNAGQLKAYLTDVVFGTTGSPAKKVSCTVAQTKRVNNADVALTDEEKATQSLVDAACEGISVSVTIGELPTKTASGSLDNLELNVKGYVAVQIVISYASGSAYVDGPMNVAFGDITINASSVAVQQQEQGSQGGNEQGSQSGENPWSELTSSNVMFDTPYVALDEDPYWADVSDFMLNSSDGSLSLVNGAQTMDASTMSSIATFGTNYMIIDASSFGANVYQTVEFLENGQAVFYQVPNSINLGDDPLTAIKAAYESYDEITDRNRYSVN